MIIKNLKIVLILAMSFCLTQCGLFEPIERYGERQFVFKNYTENIYLETTISAVEIVGKKMIVRHVEHIGGISAKNKEDFSITETEKTEKYDEIFLEFIADKDDLGALIIELSDGKKLFIEVSYFADVEGLGIASLFEIEITEDNIKTAYGITEINKIPVEDFEIIKL